MMPPTRAQAITLKGVAKSFGNFEAVRPIDLEIAHGEFLTLLGPSGCGKTTLLRMIAGLENVSSGRILLDEDDVTDLSPRERDVAIMFQDYALFPHMSVIDNVAYGLKMRGLGSIERRKTAQDWLEKLDLGPFGSRKPAALSGGQRQRVALARALITQPGALLLDEPLSALDANLRVQLRKELRRIHKDVGTTFICVTHDQEEAMTLSDRIVVLKDGGIEQIGTPNTLYDRPASAFVAQFFGRCTLLPASIVDGRSGQARAEATGFTVQTTDNHPDATSVFLVIRPETLEVCDQAVGDLTGQILDIVSKGPIVEVSVRLSDGADIQLDMARHSVALPQIGAQTALRLRSPTVAVVPRSE
ncbi:MAG: ABC transporter ATP-binding protein [Pseudomonadota bacterium]